MIFQTNIYQNTGIIDCVEEWRRRGALLPVGKNCISHYIYAVHLKSVAMTGKNKVKQAVTNSSLILAFLQ